MKARPGVVHSYYGWGSQQLGDLGGTPSMLPSKRDAINWFSYLVEGDAVWI